VGGLHPSFTNEAEVFKINEGNGGNGKGAWPCVITCVLLTVFFFSLFLPISLRRVSSFFGVHSAHNLSAPPPPSPLSNTDRPTDPFSATLTRTRLAFAWRRVTEKRKLTKRKRRWRPSNERATKGNSRTKWSRPRVRQQSPQRCPRGVRCA